MKLRFGKFGVRMFYNRMTKRKDWPPSDWPPFEKYRELPDVDALMDGISSHQLDLYYADEDVRKNRLLIDIHGGGYIANTRKQSYGFASVFLDQGYDVAVLDYPLNDGKQDIIDQVKVLAKQMAYLKSHAGELGIEGEGFFLTGDSAGGHFALLLAEMICDRALSGKICDTDLSNIRLEAVAVNCPVYDFKKAIDDSPLNNKGKAALFGPSALDDQYAALLSPKTHIASLKTPVFVSSCRNDFLRAHSDALVRDLKETGAAPKYIFMETEKWDVAHVHNVIRLSLPESRYVNSEMAVFFDQCCT